MKKVLILTTAIVALATLTACEPKRGSKEWCKKMEDMPKGEWTMNDATDYTKYCVFNQKPEEK